MDDFVLIGGSGFLGTEVALALLAEGARVTSVDRAAPPEATTAAGIGWLRADPLTEIAAVVALDQVLVLDDLVRRRAQIAREYADLPVPARHVHPGDRHSYVHWAGRFPGRDRVQRRLTQLGVQTKPYFAALSQEDHLPVTRALDAEALALPMSSEITVEQAERVSEAVRRALAL